MNTLTKSFAKRALSILLVTIMVFSLGIVGITTTSAAEVEMAETGKTNYYWKGKVYFLAPEKWDIDTYKYIQVDLTRTTNATESNYQDYIGTMTRVGDSRLFYLKVDADHSTWNKNEFMAFTANDHNYDPGTFNLNGNHYYTTPLEYDCNNENNYYLFKPTDSAANGNVMAGSWSSSVDLIKAKQDVNIYTDGALSNAGGTVRMDGQYLNDDQTSLGDSHADSSGTSAKYEGAVIGSTMKLTASNKTNYRFVGWYEGSTLVSSNKEYEYTVSKTRTISAKFETTATLTKGALTVTPTSATVGDELTFTTKATLAGSTGNIYYTLYENGTAVKRIEITYNETATIKYSPDTAGNNIYYIKAEYGNLSADTDPVTVSVTEELTASFESYDSSGYDGDFFSFIVKDNSLNLGDLNPTYKLFCKAEGDADFAEVQDAFDDGLYVATCELSTGKYKFYAEVTAAGDKAYTETVDVTVEANIPTFDLEMDYPASNFIGMDLTITATPKTNHIKPASVTYTFVSNISGYENVELTVDQTNPAKFVIPANVTDLLAEGDYTFQITAQATYSDHAYTVDPAMKTITVKMTQSTGEATVKVYFKSSISYGYQPSISTDGTTFTPMEISSYIGKNEEQSALYAWYVADLGVLKNSEKYTISINSNRTYFYKGTYVIDLLNEQAIKPSADGTAMEIYLGLDNLNKNTPTTMENLTLSDNKNWLLGAAHMIIPNDTSMDPLAELAYAYNAYAVGDANVDGKLNVRDATLIQKDLAKVSELSVLGQQVSDVNGDGKVTIKDATAVQKQIAGL